MSPRGWSRFAILMLAGNIVLAALIGRELWRRESAALVRPVAKPKIPGLRDKPITLPARPGPRVETPTTNWPPFRWASIQSPNYTNYTANLRDIGCPEETVQAIIEGATWLELARFIHGYATEKHPLLWEVLTASTNAQAQLELAYKPLETAADRRNELLRSLFRKPSQSPDETRTNEVRRRQESMQGGAYAHLSGEKLRQIAEIDVALSERSEEIRTNTPPARRNAELAILRADRDMVVTNLMNASEFEEWRLRSSFERNNRDRSIRDIGFIATNAADFAALAVARTNQTALAAALGPERAAKWASLRGSDPGTVEMFLQITRKFSLNGDIAIDAAKVHSAYRNQESEIDKDPKLYPRERRVLKALLEQQRVEKLRSLLGADAWETYRFHHEY